MSQNIRISLFLIASSTILASFVSVSTSQEPIRTCEKDDYSESKLLELLGVQSPMKDCVQEEKVELQAIIKDIFSNRTTERNPTTARDTQKPIPLSHNATSEANDMMCSSPGNEDFKHSCCPVGQWPDKDGACRSLF